MTSAAPACGKPSTVTRCVTWPEGERRAGVRCYTADGDLIQCCGHGLLCSAWHWLAHWQGEGVLSACDGEVPCYRDDNTTWVGLPGLALAPCPVPDWLPRMINGPAGHAAVRCANAGPQDGYLVIELAAGTDLTNLTPPDAILADYTRRALIVTCRVDAEHALCGEHIRFRYFAPQYGVPEDSATGSAMRILARYWETLGNELTALQDSPAGGYLRSRLDGERVWVGGTVTTASNGAVAYG